LSKRKEEKKEKEKKKRKETANLPTTRNLYPLPPTNYHPQEGFFCAPNGAPHGTFGGTAGA